MASKQSKQVTASIKGKKYNVDTQKGVGAALKNAMPEVEHFTANTLAHAAQLLGRSLDYVEKAVVGIGQDPVAELQARIGAREDALKAKAKGQEPVEEMEKRLKARNKK